MPTANRDRRLPPDAEVRALVARVLDEVLASEEAAAVPEDNAAFHEMAPSSESMAGAPSVSIAIGADHGGYPMKERLGFRLRESGYEVIDCGTDSPESADYPAFAHAVAKRVAQGEARWGIVVDGAGIGSAMVANKVPGIRAALCYDISSARNSREHNHANVLTLGAGMVGDGLAWQIVQEWLSVDWAEGRHARRVEMIGEIESEYLKNQKSTL